MEAGFNYSELKSMDIMEIYVFWLALGRQKELKACLKWYADTMAKIKRKASKQIKRGDGTTRPPTKEEIKNNIARLKIYYFRRSQEEEEAEKAKYFNSIINVRNYLQKHKGKNKNED